MSAGVGTVAVSAATCVTVPPITHAGTKGTLELFLLLLRQSVHPFALGGLAQLEREHHILVLWAVNVMRQWR